MLRRRCADPQARLLVVELALEREQDLLVDLARLVQLAQRGALRRDTVQTDHALAVDARGRGTSRFVLALRDVLGLPLVFADKAQRELVVFRLLLVVHARAQIADRGVADGDPGGTLLAFDRAVVRDAQPAY